MKIPFAKPNLGLSELNEIKDTLKSGVLVHGKKSLSFEKMFFNLVNPNYGLSTSSCTSALHMAAICINLKNNHEVMISAQTHVATAHAIEAVGARPVFIDSNEENGNINLDDLEKKITKKTRALVIVHFLGAPQPMDEIMKFVRKHNLKLIEDCALSLGAKYKGKSVGTFGDYGCFSFHPVKMITTGEGGFLTIKNKKDYIRSKDLRSFGVRKNFYERSTPGLYDVPEFGLNFRMGELNSSLGIVQLGKFSVMLKKRQSNYKRLKKHLLKNKNFRILNTESNKISQSSYYCMNIILNKSLVKHRNRIIKKINDRGVGTSIYYPLPVPHFLYYKKKYNISSSSYKVSLLLSNSTISLPVGPHISKDEVDFIAKTINKILV